MSAWVTQNVGSAPSVDDLEEHLLREGSNPSRWSNGPHDRYSWHEHGYHKALYCASGSIVFHTDAGDHALAAGDRLDVEPGTAHGATVGPEGVQCVEVAV